MNSKTAIPESECLVVLGRKALVGGIRNALQPSNSEGVIVRDVTKDVLGRLLIALWLFIGQIEAGHEQ